uniref:Voltage-dependent calcium channel subunit alpha-2/delta-3 n=1 Tax=Cacopsylla melanoneura TaxID=428564 RepID=A0A8D8RY65_9HEMI
MARSSSMGLNNGSLALIILAVLLGLLESSLQQDEDIPHNEVKNWALKFGIDLWEFGRHFTNVNEIQRKFQDRDATVVRKDGLILIRELAAEVKNMIDIKINTVMRILESAEQAALSQKSDSGGNAKYLDSRKLTHIPADQKPTSTHEMFFQVNRHFDQCSVNTSFSSVLLPQAMTKDPDEKVLNALKWSEHLDPVFLNNYETDPSLSWQYFGSTLGFLRRYPAMKWPVDGSSQDLHDFRSAAWFVEAATSPKDIVILLDTSSALSSKHRNLARATINVILDTLGPNDFVNIFTFSDVTVELVSCYKEMLVQATDQNKRTLKVALANIKSENTANFTGALATAFEILHKFNRTGQGCQCNQAIMLVSSGSPSAFKEVFKHYNWPHMPVRLFSYLIGKSSNFAEMKQMACSNKGYFELIKNTDRLREKVFNYILVMARPLIMYQTEHPLYWSPVYTGGKTNTLVGDDVKEGKLMVSVSTPVFDKRNYSTRAANLLGVAAVDVPIQQIKKLVPQYKLGPNAYSFVVNNNGRVIYHPDFRPLLDKNKYVEKLKPNYNNVDLSEVEIVDSELYPRDNNSLLLDLRHDMIDQKEGETEIKVKLHYDELRRVTSRRHRYFYHPIEGTPYSLGLALPDGYGLYEVSKEEEIKLSAVNVTDYFKGSNWKVHPDWVYCEYNYADDVNFQSPEEQVLHFLARTRQPGWKWMSLRPRAPQEDSIHSYPKKLERQSYFCDKSLMQSLVFDAMVTEGLEHPSVAYLKGDKQQGYSMFGVTLSFLATRSGLIRWKEHVGAMPGSGLDFAEKYRRAMDDIWFQRAVDHHTIEPDSFVFSVPHNSGPRGEKPLVTASHAVFIENKGHRAPAMVVGLQFQHSALASHFINITSTCTAGIGCKKTCASDDLDCYVLDNNGFIILSEKYEQTGLFFGQADGTIMDSLVQDGIYKRVPMDDYQGVCEDSKVNDSDAAASLKPWQPVFWLFNWFLGHLFWAVTNLQIISTEGFAQEDSDTPVYSDYDQNYDTDLPSPGEGDGYDTMDLEAEMDETISEVTKSFPVDPPASTPDKGPLPPPPPPHTPLRWTCN